ncbi:MAG: response regulator, partial [Rhodospirillaceae bacterium]|nr:response regulator [Rhodospirillaceae bacterium]
MANIENSSSPEFVTGARILVVDDNRMSRKLIGMVLEGDAHAVVAVASGREALEAVAAHPFDLIFLDLLMPEMSGQEVLAALKGDDRYKAIPVVIVSGAEDTHTATDCLAAGAAAFLPKPVDKATVRAVLSTELGNETSAAGTVAADAPSVGAKTDLADVPVFDAATISRLNSDF